MGQPATDVDLEGLREYLETTAVHYAVLFGSYARDDASSTSDIDICLRFPDEWSRHERFRHRNRIDAVLQTYADGFVDVSDFESLPAEVGRNALRDGILLCGDEASKAADERRLERQVEDAKEMTMKKRRAFVDRLANGDV